MERILDEVTIGPYETYEDELSLQGSVEAYVTCATKLKRRSGEV